MAKLLIGGGGSSSSRLGRNYTLDDLEENEQFQEVAERFLTSVGENSNDVFEYLRDSDFNLFSGMQRAIESGKFTDQQKKDYKYLRTRFDNADMGSFKQYLSLTKDATIDIATDPTAILAAILTPVTGGTSLAIKSGISKGVIEGSKAIAKGQLKDVGRKQIGKTALITGAEVGTWTGLDNHFRQNTELNTDIRKLYSNPELVGSAALGFLTGGVLGGFVQRNSLFNDRLSRLYSNDTYRKESKLKYNIKKGGAKLLAKTIGNASTIMKPFAKYSDTAADLGARFSEEFSKKIGERSTKRIGWNYSEDLGNRRGNYLLDFDNIVAPLRTTGQILPEDEIAVIRILRGGSRKGASKEVKKVADDLRKFFDKIDADARAAGIETQRIENYFTRHWNREAIENDTDGVFRNLLVSKGIVNEKDVDEVIAGMLNKQNELYSSHSNLITQSRVFKNMNDNDFEEFLTNDLVPVTTNYFMNAAKTIEHKLHFLGKGKNVRVLNKYKVKDGTDEETRLLLFKQSNDELFKKKWIDKIEKELRDNGKQTLTAKDKKDILNTYKSITGQVDYFDSGLMQGTYDTIKLANAMAYLPLATVSSLSEAFITLGRAPTSSAIKGYQDGITKGHKIFTDEMRQLLKEKHKMPEDEIRREMNSIFIAVDEVMGDVTNRISGEGLQNPFLKKAARGFYRFNLLIPWTKTVQLTAFSTGKDLITDNLSKLYNIQQKSKLSIKRFASDEFAQDFKVQKLKGELFDLGVDVEEGLKWAARGSKTNENFYKNYVIRGAGRFTNGIILPTARESARVPTFMTNPKIDILTQFLRYPTVFGNTILKNFARDAITNPAVSAPKIAAFVAMATNVAKATNYWRSSEEKRKKTDRGKEDWHDTLKAYQRVGLLGPIEYGLRVSEGLTYGQNPLVAGIGVGGPVINDVIGMTLYNRGLLETAARKLPLTGTKTVFDRNLGDFMEEYTGFREPYTPIQKSAKEADKFFGSNIRGIASIFAGEPEDSSKRLLRATGGLIPKVDPYTGIPYEIKKHRIEFHGGGLASKMQARNKKRVDFSVGSLVSKTASKLKVFHGSPKSIKNKFELGEGAMEDGVGFYFTDADWYAKSYAGTTKGQRNLYEVEINVKENEFIDPKKWLPVNKKDKTKEYLSAKEYSKVLKAFNNVIKDLENKKMPEAAKLLKEKLQTENIYSVVQGYEKLFYKKGLNVKYPLFQDALREQGIKGFKIPQEWRAKFFDDYPDKGAKDRDELVKEITYVIFNSKDIGKYSRKQYRTGLSVEKDVSDVEDDPADRSVDNTGQSFREVAEQDTEVKIPDAVTNVPLTEKSKVIPIVKTKETSRVGRPIWKGTLDGKEIFYSERTVTFPLNKEGTQWVTFPSINKEGLEIEEENLRQYILENGPVDFITGEEFPIFNTEKEASSYAAERSPSLRVQKNEGSMMKEVVLDIVGEQILSEYNITDDEEGKRKFVNLVYEVAKQENHPNPIFAVTQAVLETGWGTKAGGNIYGIKARKGEKTKTVRTRELEGEELVLTDEEFVDLSNESVKKNVQHYNDLMTREYPQVLTELSQGNIEEAAKHLQSKEKGGYRDNTNYATDPDYINKVVELYPFVEKRIQGLDKT